MAPLSNHVHASYRGTSLYRSRLIQEVELSSVLYYLNTLVQLHRTSLLAATSARALPLASVVLVVRCAFTLITANFFGSFMANIKSFTNPACLMGDPAEVEIFWFAK